MLYNPISDCGCFGEAIHLTNTQTFIKNVILLVLAFLIFLGRKRATRLAPAWMEWMFVGIFALLALAVSVRALATIPQVDFTAYRVGNSLDRIRAGNIFMFCDIKRDDPVTAFLCRCICHKIALVGFAPGPDGYRFDP